MLNDSSILRNWRTSGYIIQTGNSAATADIFRILFDPSFYEKNFSKESIKKKENKQESQKSQKLSKREMKQIERQQTLEELTNQISKNLTMKDLVEESIKNKPIYYVIGKQHKFMSNMNQKYSTGLSTQDFIKKVKKEHEKAKYTFHFFIEKTRANNEIYWRYENCKFIFIFICNWPVIGEHNEIIEEMKKKGLFEDTLVFFESNLKEYYSSYFSSWTIRSNIWVILKNPFFCIII